MRQAGRFARAAREAFQATSYEVQTTRLAAPPFMSYLPQAGLLPALAQTVEKLAAEHGIGYVSLGPAYPDNLESYAASYAAIPAALAATQNAFFAGSLTTPDGRISLPAVRACAQVIHQAAGITPDGFTNMRFAALANVAAGSPFLPAAYHTGDSPAFAIATEAADLAVQAFRQAGTLLEAQQALSTIIEQHAHRLEETAGKLARQFEVRFNGIDFSLAPFPDEALSLGAAMEALGVSSLGLHGSLAAAAILAEAIDRAQFRRTGFSGLLLPVLEDAILSKRAAQGKLSVKDLLLYSAVCGAGLDTLPLAGDVTPEQLSALLLDVGALAVRLGKPLTARLMPIPGKAAGDLTGFDFAYFANSRVLALEAAPLQGLLTGDDQFILRPRKVL
jgi:uncharacterized protein (UPF0210 family)